MNHNNTVLLVYGYYFCIYGDEYNYFLKGKSKYTMNDGVKLLESFGYGLKGVKWSLGNSVTNHLRKHPELIKKG